VSCWVEAHFTLDARCLRGFVAVESPYPPASPLGLAGMIYCEIVCWTLGIGSAESTLGFISRDFGILKIEIKSELPQSDKIATLGV